MVKYLAECRTSRVDVLPPDINESEKQFTVVKGKIRFGLLSVKNVDEAVVDAIIKERSQNDTFTFLFDFCKRISLAKVTPKVLESLIKSGVFDSTGATRAQMMAAIDDAESNEPPGIIRPCPFCGHGQPEIHYYVDPDEVETADESLISDIACDNPDCQAIDPTIGKGSLVMLWNDRTE
ncbi:MAG: hypothetical protein ACKVE4_04940 [Dissulfuribacterales bacterium]